MASISMTLQDMRDFVRNALDTDSTDLPDSLLDRYIADGSNRVDEHSSRWSFRAIDYSFATVANQQAYDIRSAARVSGITYPIIDIVDVRGPNWSLSPKDHAASRARWRRTSLTTNQNPSEFSLWGDSIYLWPAPTGGTTISITGYRDAIDWISLNSTPDFPGDFHELIAWWALNRGHAREGDPQMADFYRGEFEATLQKRADAWMTGLDAQPLVIGESGSREQWRARNGMGPLIYSWE